LGLAAVYGIIEIHQGWLEVDSTVGQGTEFRIFLPVADGKRVSPKREVTSSLKQRGTETILAVEDEPALQRMVVHLLSGLGYQVLAAANGRKALELWEAHGDQVHLLLTDLVMPEGISGKQLAEQLRAQKPSLKIIYTSGYSQDVAGTELQLQDGVNFLAKPYLPLELSRLVRKCLDNH
jgi:two-component system, cell cycle sensor histidine kinase and response regulator CckA